MHHRLLTLPFAFHLLRRGSNAHFSLSVLQDSVSNWSFKAPSPKISGEEELSLPKAEEVGGEMPQCFHSFFQSLSSPSTPNLMSSSQGHKTWFSWSSQAVLKSTLQEGDLPPTIFSLLLGFSCIQDRQSPFWHHVVLFSSTVHPWSFILKPSEEKKVSLPLSNTILDLWETDWLPFFPYEQSVIVYFCKSSFFFFF